MKRSISTAVLTLMLVLTLIFGAVPVMATETTVPDEAGAPDITLETDPETGEPIEESRWREGFSPLSGLPIAEEDENRKIFAFSMGNQRPARMQAGLRSAELIFEFRNEANSSRFVALFMTQPVPERLGGLRSARPVMVERILEYDAVFVHVGGSPDGNRYIEEFDVTNFDAIRLPQTMFWRYNQTGKKSPHNLYTDLDILFEKAERYGISMEPSAFKGYLFNEEVLPLNGKPALEFEINLASQNVKRYEYDEETKTYLRYENNELHLDELDREPLTPVNIIVQEAMSHVYTEHGHRKMDQIGEGRALYFSHGEMIELTWEKEDERAMTVFYTEDGEELVLNPGQMFIQVVDSLDDLEILNPEPVETEAETEETTP